MVTIVIIGAIASAALPLFNKTMEIQLAKRAIMDLKVVAAAQEVYKTKYAKYWPADGTSHDTPAEFKNELGLNFNFHNKLEYSCSESTNDDDGTINGSSYKCCVGKNNDAWIYRYQTYTAAGNPALEIFCVSGPCPVLP